MEIIGNILHLPALVGVIFMIVATIMYFFPPKKINYLYGYRTESSMKSQERWDFAQRYSSIKMIQVGAALFLVSLIGMAFPVSEGENIAIGLILMIPACIVMFWTTEKALKKNFPNS